jgi:RNA polymerase sigma-70 factor, ECF subfamily
LEQSHHVLIRRCQAGDQEAFGHLFEQYKNLVYRTTYLSLGSAADADDILQEVFLQLYRSLSAYDPSRGSLSTWLYRITVNRCLNWRRRRRPADSLEALDEERLGNSLLVSDCYAEDEPVRRALAGLSRKLRVVVVVRHYCDLSYAEIAEITDLPLGTVESRLTLAMRQLRAELEAEFVCSARSLTEAQP